MDEKIIVSEKDCVVVGFPFEKKDKKPIGTPGPENVDIDYCVDENGNGISAEDAEESIWEYSEYEFE